LEAPSVERKLAAIFAADVEGYSRLMGRDEVNTLRTLTAYRAIVDRLIASHRGRIFNTAGDSVLADFASAVDGVQCAVAVQEAIAKENADRPADEQMWFRIGLHVGDVMVQGDNLLGDAVNVAARLEALAEPGGTCISGTLRDQIGIKLPLLFTDLGEQQVKNIIQPIRAFRISDEKLPSVPRVVDASLPLPDKPSIAVLPFANMSGDPEQEYFADGIAEDVITALSRYPSLFVIARNSSFTYKGHAVNVTQVGRELGVRYVLEGSLRKFGSRIRVSAQLVEAEAGKHVWAERYDRELADIFAVQDEITDAVTIAIAPAIAKAEQRRVMRKPPQNLDAWGAYQRGLWHLGKFGPEDNTLSQRFFQQSIDLDPNFAGGYSGLAIAKRRGVQRLGLLEQNDVLELARRAVVLDPDDAEGRARLGFILLGRGDPDGALAEVESALTISPNLASAHGVLGQILLCSGHPKEGRASLEKSIRLDPRDPMAQLNLLNVAISYFLSGEYDAAIEAAKRVIRAYPDYPMTYPWFVAALGQTGRIEEAKQALQGTTLIAPGAFDLYVRSRAPWHRPEDLDHLIEGLSKAGWEG
jgi:adenylate cyclase